MIPGLSDNHLMPGLSWTVRLLSEAGPLLDRSATLRSRASHGLFGHYTVPGFSQTIRMISQAGLLPNHPATPETAQGLSTKARTYLYDNYNNNVPKCNHLRTYTPDNNTYMYDTQLYQSLPSHWCRSVLDQIREQTDFARSNPSGATVNGASNHWRRSGSLQMTRYFPGLYTTLDKLLRYTYYIMRSVIRYTCS